MSHNVTCSVCGTVNRSAQAFCSGCNYNLHMKHSGARFDRPDLNGESTRREQWRSPESEPEEHQQPPTASFSCFRCREALRIRLPQANAVFRCPKCRIQFTVAKAGDSPLVFVVLPDLDQFTGSYSQASGRAKREIPADVREALALFALAESTGMDEIRRVYRQQVQLYHPDKVAHLGHDLRQVAEAKTKDLNLAFQVLEKFYAG